MHGQHLLIPALVARDLARQAELFRNCFDRGAAKTGLSDGIIQQQSNATSHRLGIPRRHQQPSDSRLNLLRYPPTAVAITGVPQAMASRMVFGKVSARAACR